MENENDALESENTPNDVETENSPEEAETSKNTQKDDSVLTPEQKSKLDSFDRIYAENKSLKSRLSKKAEVSEVNTEELWEAPNDPLEVVRLGKTLKDYTEEETEFIIRNAPTKDIKGIMTAEKDAWVQTAINAKREKVAKERALNPSTQQPEPEKEKTLGEKLKSANLSEKEKLLEEVGLWKSPKVRSFKDRIPLSR